MNLKIIFRIDPRTPSASDRYHKCDKFSPNSANNPAFCDELESKLPLEPSQLEHFRNYPRPKPHTQVPFSSSKSRLSIISKDGTNFEDALDISNNSPAPVSGQMHVPASSTMSVRSWQSASESGAVSSRREPRSDRDQGGRGDLADAAFRGLVFRGPAFAVQQLRFGHAQQIALIVRLLDRTFAVPSCRTCAGWWAAADGIVVYIQPGPASGLYLLGR